MKNKSNSWLSFIVTVTALIAVTICILIIPFIKRSKNSASVCGHEYKEVNQIVAGEFNPGYIIYKCSKCGDEKTERIKSVGILPQMYFDGNIEGIGKDSEVIIKAEYIDEEKSFQTVATLKYQGHTAMMYDKKNYTVKFYEDENKSKKNKVSLHGWKESNKYCLKANYIDFSQSRNIVSANIWRDVVASRKDIDKNIADLQYYGAIDGYPIMLFMNDEYQGIYTMNIPKDDDTYNIGNDQNEALFVINSSNSDSAYFKSTLSDDDKKSVFDLEYCWGEDEGNTDWAYQSINNLISFVMTHNGQEFKTGIEKYLDVNSAIDYLLTTYYLGLTDNFAKNALMLTYNGEKWIFSLYDMDTAFGLAFDGTKFYEPDFQLPKRNNDGSISSSTGSLLWDRMLQCFYPEICERYKELRETVFQNENVIKRYNDFIDSIPNNYFEKDLEIWKDLPLHNENNIEQMRSFLSTRSSLLDVFFIK